MHDSIIIRENVVDKSFVDGLLAQKNFIKSNILGTDTGDTGIKFARFRDKINNRDIVSRCRIINHPVLNTFILTNLFKKINEKYFKLNIDWKTSRPVSFIKKYCEHDAGHMDWHDDLMYNPNSEFGWRALSMSLILKENNCKGGNLEFKRSWKDKKILDVPRLKKYSAVFFKPQLPHRVTMVTKGQRIALISWIYTKENIYA